MIQIVLEQNTITNRKGSVLIYRSFKFKSDKPIHLGKCHKLVKNKF